MNTGQAGVPAIPSAELVLLNGVRAWCLESARLRNLAYAVMNQTLKGARYQATGVALKALSSTKDDSQITPITIYSDNLDAGNLIELAINPEKLADALSIDKNDIGRWLNHLQNSVAVWAEPKTVEKYPRVGVRSALELDGALIAWHQLVASRKWPILAGGQNNQQVSSDIRVEKAGTDAGFDITTHRDGEWLIFNSSAFTTIVGVASGAGESYQVGISDVSVGLKVAAEFGVQATQDSGRWALQMEEVKGYTHLHEILMRIACLASVIAGQGLKEFEAQTKSPPESTEAIRLVMQRIGQSIFRQSLLDYWGERCALTGLDVRELLRASHIKPWARCDSDAERLDVFNGLLLAPHIDALFDGGWITFTDSGGMLVSDALGRSQKGLLGLHAVNSITGLTDAHRNYMQWHRKNRFRRA